MKRHTTNSPETSNFKITGEDEEEGDVVYEKGMRAISLDDGDLPHDRPVPQNTIFANRKSNPELVREELHRYDEALKADTSLVGQCRHCIFTGLYYTILRMTSFIIYCNIAMLSNLIFLATYERSKDVNYAFAIGVVVPCTVGFFVWLFEYIRNVNGEIRNYNDRIKIRFISAASLSCCDVSVFAIHMTLFSCLLISCIVVTVKCDTPGTPCNDIYSFLANPSNSTLPP